MDLQKYEFKREKPRHMEDNLLLVKKIHEVKPEKKAENVFPGIAQPSPPPPSLLVTVTPQAETVRHVNFSPLTPIPPAKVHSAVEAQLAPEVAAQQDEDKVGLGQTNTETGKGREMKRKRVEDEDEDEGDGNERFNKKQKNNNSAVITIYNCLKNTVAQAGSILMQGFAKIFMK